MGFLGSRRRVWSAFFGWWGGESATMTDSYSLIALNCNSSLLVSQSAAKATSMLGKKGAILRPNGESMWRDAGIESSQDILHT